MKKKKFQLSGFAALALALTLGLTACGGDVGIISGSDGPTSIYIGDNTITFGDEDSPAEPKEPEKSEEPEQTEDSEQPEESVSSDSQAPGTTAGQNEEPPYEDTPALEEDGTYNSAEDVSLYLTTYGRLPENYITKREARELGWSGGSVEQVAPGCAIGGDTFGNREDVLPEGTYHECDIDTIGQSSRGAKRLVYADDGRIYYTEDHYETFTLLYGEE